MSSIKENRIIVSIADLGNADDTNTVEVDGFSDTEAWQFIKKHGDGTVD